jgi:hypothetical protein
VILGAGLLVLLSSRLAAQTHDHGAHGKSPAPPDWAGLSERARAQLKELQASVASMATPDAAKAAGFRPVLGLIPTMGVHWVNPSRVRDRAHFDLGKPDHLMFAPVNGEQKLVGIAFAYHAPPGAARPEGFDGDADTWHEHPFLAPPGQTLTMLHVWFVPSPDGPFAGHNPYLPYWAVGLEPPPAARMQDAADARRIRTLAVALSETVDSVNFVQRTRRIAGLDGKLEPQRNAIRARIPELRAAAMAGDVNAWNRAADAAIAEWQKIRETYLAAIPTARGRQRLSEFFEEMISGAHGVHGMPN